ncbi:MAG: type II toxin-antitoxin system HicB family antitoxin [Parvibaculum sp.]|uniref:type II toxin-antitoxin system HicB family antitoxin n=1 Tax=Parvibaculum sp. TaxID=2024848 RepID=UPI000CBFB5FC|nr:type II toxin-antitoxin system HicB family antitoxin [Parvibaculum sp.]MDZ4380658.1 type II toxin-antitoxin system HicB family antitoxin [Parvibaculum sp.]PKP76188.1 MAG: CopG family transcriptional regulator [Alphaproteobacteria bacterium HGW-Alphaproteobacteria-3]
MRYVAMVHKQEDTGYGVSFPDFPGCIAAGGTLGEALADAANALAFHVEGMRDDKEPIPAPRELDEIVADPALTEDREGAFLTLVPLIEDRGISKRVNISLDPGLLEAIDEAAKERGMTRSNFLASAARQALTA